MGNFEEIRSSYRPDRIAALFVGESAPHGGTFFYNQDSRLFFEVKKAFHGDIAFLEEFKRNGFYLDDLVLEPVNQLENKDRRLRSKCAMSSLADRLKDHNPQAVVILLKRIETMVRSSIREAGLSCEIYCTPYPGFGNQRRFHEAMTEIIPKLPVVRGDKLEGTSK